MRPTVRVVLIVGGLFALLGAVHIPAAEWVLYRFRHENPIGIFVLACAISGLQLAGEYFLAGEAGRRIKSAAKAIRAAIRDWFATSPKAQQLLQQVPESVLVAFRQLRGLWQQVRAAWSDLKSWLTPVLKPGGYGAVLFSAFFSRVVSVAIWRATKLKGAVWIIIGLSLVRLLLIAGASQMLR